jgi:hypothetical protein
MLKHYMGRRTENGLPDEAPEIKNRAGQSAIANFGMGRHACPDFKSQVWIMAPLLISNMG